MITYDIIIYVILVHMYAIRSHYFERWCKPLNQLLPVIKGEGINTHSQSGGNTTETISTDRKPTDTKPTEAEPTDSPVNDNTVRTN